MDRKPGLFESWSHVALLLALGLVTWGVLIGLVLLSWHFAH